MKRLIAVMLAFTFLLCFVGCNKEDDTPSSPTKTKTVMPVTESSRETDKAEEENTKAAKEPANQQQSQKQAQQQSQQQAQQQSQQTQQSQQSQQQQQQNQSQNQQQQSTPSSVDTSETPVNTENIISSITDQQVISALMEAGGSISGNVMATVYKNMTPERQEKVKEALATATDATGNVDISQFSSLISSLFKK